MNFLRFRYSPLAFFLIACLFTVLYGIIAIAYGNKVPSLAIIGIGNFGLALVMFVLRNRKAKQ